MIELFYQFNIIEFHLYEPIENQAIQLEFINSPYYLYHIIIIISLYINLYHLKHATATATTFYR